MNGSLKIFIIGAGLIVILFSAALAYDYFRIQMAKDAARQASAETHKEIIEDGIAAQYLMNRCLDVRFEQGYEPQDALEQCQRILAAQEDFIKAAK